MIGFGTISLVVPLIIVICAVTCDLLFLWGIVAFYLIFAILIAGYAIYCSKINRTLTTDDDGITIYFEFSKAPRLMLSVNSTKIFVAYENIRSIEYYRMTSIRAWIELLVSTKFADVPRCAYVKFKDDMQLKRVNIGYMTHKEACKLAEICKLTLNER